MESLVLYRKAILLAADSNRISSTSNSVSDIYANLKAVQQERLEQGKLIRLPMRNILQD